MYNDSLFNAFARSFEARSETDMSMAEYLESCRGDPMRYANAAERLLAAIGEPQMIDTAKDPRLGRIFLNRTMRVYPAFAGFHGMEETIERIVGFFRHAAQGLEERKQILYLLGPVGGGKSSLAERLKSLMEVHPIYVLKAGDELSPVFESPLGLFDPEQLGPMIEENYGIPRRRLTGLDEPVVPTSGSRRSAATSRASASPRSSRRGCARSRSPRPSRATRTTRTSPRWSARSISASSRPSRRTIPTPTATPAASTAPTRAFSNSSRCSRRRSRCCIRCSPRRRKATISAPRISARSRSPASSSRTRTKPNGRASSRNKNNEAFIDRICVIKVPYCLRVTEEQKIYEKLISGSELAAAPCAPSTLETLARFSVMSRLRKHENSTPFAKMRVYDGESLKETDPKARSVQEYRDAAGVDEGMDGVSTRFAFKVLAATFNHDTTEDRRRSRAPDVRAGAVDPPRAVVPTKSRSAISNSSRPSSRRAMRSSSATKSRRRIWNPIPTTARTCSTVTSITPTPGSRIRTSRIPTPARCSIANCSTRN